MLADVAEMQPESARVRRRKLRLRTVESLDNRTVAGRRASQLIRAFEAQLGGKLAGAQLLAVHRAATLVAIAQDAQVRRLAGDLSITLVDVVRMDNVANRAVQALGLDRRPQPSAASLPSLGTLMKGAR
jgi:hypothetical protein